MNTEKRRLKRKKKKGTHKGPNLIKVLLAKTGLTLEQEIEKGYIKEIKL